MSLLPNNFVVIDCETSGLDPARHALLSLGAVKASGEEYYAEFLFDETKELDPAAMAVNGLALKNVEQGDDFPEIGIQKFLTWLAKDAARWIVGGKNPRFDYEFLCAAERPGRRSVRELLCRRTIDLHSLAYWWAVQHEIDIGAEGFDTQMVYGHLGFQPEPKPHHALTGARLEMRIFRALSGPRSVEVPAR